MHAAFLEDLRFLQSIGWLSQMRALHVSFLAYNANHRIWVWNQLPGANPSSERCGNGRTRPEKATFPRKKGRKTAVLGRFSFEHTAFGTIHPLVYQQPFRPRLFELGQDVELLVCDVARVCLALFVIFQALETDSEHGLRSSKRLVMRCFRPFESHLGGIFGLFWIMS